MLTFVAFTCRFYWFPVAIRSPVILSLRFCPCSSPESSKRVRVPAPATASRFAMKGANRKQRREDKTGEEGRRGRGASDDSILRIGIDVCIHRGTTGFCVLQLLFVFFGYEPFRNLLNHPSRIHDHNRRP